jgi:hypothetical protein
VGARWHLQLPCSAVALSAKAWRAAEIMHPLHLWMHSAGRRASVQRRRMRYTALAHSVSLLEAGYSHTKLHSQRKYTEVEREHAAHICAATFQEMCWRKPADMPVMPFSSAPKPLEHQSATNVACHVSITQGR